MKTLKFLFAGAIAIAVLFACSDEEKIEPEPEPEVPEVPDEPEEPTEEDYAATATISSDDTYFAFSEEDGYTVSFKTEGGQVVVNVDCGTDWDVENSAEDVFTAECDYDNATLTISAEPNTVEEELTGTITLMTLPSKIEFASITVTQNAYGAVEIKVESNEWHVAAVGDNLSTTVSVEANDEWEVENTADWLTVEKGDAAVTITAKENEETEERTADITLTCTDGISTDSQIIRVSQDARAYIALGSTSISLPAYDGEITVTVESNFEWEYLCEADWLTVAKSRTDTALSIIYVANDGDEDRETVVTLTAGDGEANTTKVILAVKQNFVNPEALILEYAVSSKNTQIKLPIYGVNGVNVDWGDGDAETVSSNNPAHTYSGAGVYYVFVNGGTVSQLKSATGTSASNVVAGAECLTAVKQWGAYGFTSMEYAFRGCSNLKSLPDGPGPFAGVTTFKYAFSQTALSTLPEGLLDNITENATTFEYCFNEAIELESIPDALFARCSNVTLFNSVFGYCIKLSAIPKDTFMNCAAATTFSSAFRYCYSLGDIPAGLFDDCVAAKKFDYVFSMDEKSGYDFFDSVLTTIPEGLFEKNAEATSFDHSFCYCTALKSIPDRLFYNKEKVTTYSYCFRECSALTSIPANLFGMQASATDLSYIFRGCASLSDSGIPEGLLDGCTEVTLCQGFFYNCAKLTKLPVGLFDKCVKCTNLESVFRGCTGLRTLDAGFFKPLTSVTNFNYAFSGCTGLKELPADLFGECLKVNSFKETFNGCVNLTGESPYTEKDDVKIHLYERTSSNGFEDIESRNRTNCFTGCVGLTDFADILSAGWATE